MQTKYTVGMVVRARDDRSYKGEVVEVVGEDEMVIKWEDGEIVSLEPSEIVPYDPEADKVNATKVQAKIDEATAALKVAFEAWKEAQDIYDSEGYAIKRDDLIDLSKFEAVIEKNGWSTSSLYC